MLSYLSPFLLDSLKLAYKLFKNSILLREILLGKSLEIYIYRFLKPEMVFVS